MSDEPWSPLEELASTHTVDIVDSWGRSSLVLRDTFDVDALGSHTGRPGFTVQLLPMITPTCH
jgi:hypothetical protein